MFIFIIILFITVIIADLYNNCKYCEESGS